MFNCAKQAKARSAWAKEQVAEILEEASREEEVQDDDESDQLTDQEKAEAAITNGMFLGESCNLRGFPQQNLGVLGFLILGFPAADTHAKNETAAWNFPIASTRILG